MKKENITMGSERTTLARANIKSYSLRTTVPKGIVNHFDLKEGDYLLWTIRPSPDGKGLVITVIPEHVTKGRKK